MHHVSSDIIQQLLAVTKRHYIYFLKNEFLQQLDDILQFR